MAATASAQTMHVRQGAVDYAFAAAQTGEMTVDAATSLTIQGRTFPIAAIDRIDIDGAEVAAASVRVDYAGTEAHITVSGDVARYIDVAVDGAHVTVTAAPDLADEVTYTLTGTAPDGSFTQVGQLKMTLVFDNLTLTSTRGAAIDIDNGKRIAIRVPDGTTTTLTDAAGGPQKACLNVKGHAELTGGGTLNLVGRSRHAFRSGEYMQVKAKFGTLNVTAAAGDALHVGQYFQMNGGTLALSGMAGDGIDVEATLKDDERDGQAIIEGGILTITATADDVKALKADSAITIAGGTLRLTVTGAGSKGISTDGTLSILGGSVTAVASGGIYAEGTDLEAKPHGLKCDADMTIAGGDVRVAAMQRAFSTDAEFHIDGGTVMGVGTKSSTPTGGTQGYATYKNVSVSGGATLSYDGLTFAIPTAYSNSAARVLVSTPQMRP